MSKFSSALLVLGGIALVGVAMADGGNAVGIAKISGNITDTFESVGKLITAVSYVSGLCMVVLGIFKFKQHKDNPQQVPMGTPITILGVGALLIFFPNIVQPAGDTIFGENAKAGGFKGDNVYTGSSSK